MEILSFLAFMLLIISTTVFFGALDDNTFPPYFGD